MKLLSNYFLLVFFLAFFTQSHADHAYLQKFLTYQRYSQNLPKTADAAFEAFIAEPSPLTRRLREKWLYQLAWNKDWAKYSQYYRPSTDVNLQCYAQLARYHQGLHAQVAVAIKPLWLSGTSQPKSCDALFTVLLSQHAISDALIYQRLQLALEKRNVSLARYLLKQLRPALTAEADILSHIYQQPTRITDLTPSLLHSEFYLFGLKLLAQRNMPHAIALWLHPKSQKMLNEKQHQAFIAHVALYKAMRQQNDAAHWFGKIKANYYSDVLLDWHMRHAIAQHNWAKVIELAQQAKNKDEPNWQYWQARAHEGLKHSELAQTLYLNLAQKRNYYGFLASIKLKQPPQFANEAATQDLNVIAVYKPILNQIQDLYQHRQSLAASRLLNDFVMELPKHEKSALAYWLDHHLQWYGKSVYLSNIEELNNQLTLRFPLAYRVSIQQYAQQYNIPPALVYAMIRQESGFREDIVSPVGANGLMQLMPTTAKLVANHAKIPYFDIKDLYISHKNIQIGIAYLNQLAKQYHMHPLLMAAAYNAGPRQVNHWLRNQPSQEIDIWIESLPWQETRNYLKNIVAFYAVYQYRLQEQPNLETFLQPLTP